MRVPRIIGVVLLLLAALALYLKNYMNVVVLALAGLILFFLPKKLSDESLKDFLQIRTQGMLFVKCFVLDIVFWLLFFLLLVGSGSVLKSLTARLAANSSLQNLADVAVLQQNVAAAKNFMWSSIGVIVLVLIVFFFIYSLTRFFVWSFIVKRQKFSRFLLLNLLWWLVWLPVFALLLFGFRPAFVPYISIVAFGLYAFFTAFVHYNYFRHGKISIGKALASGASNACLFVIPFTYVIAVFVALFQLTRLAPPTSWISNLVSFIFVVVLFCLARIYFANVIRKHNVV